MDDDGNCLHCRIMEAIEEWAEEEGCQIHLDTVIANLGDVAGHVMAICEIEHSPQAFGQFAQALLQETVASYNAHYKLAQQPDPADESSEGHTIN